MKNIIKVYLIVQLKNNNYGIYRNGDLQKMTNVQYETLLESKSNFGNLNLLNLAYLSKCDDSISFKNDFLNSLEDCDSSILYCADTDYSSLLPDIDIQQSLLPNIDLYNC